MQQLAVLRSRGCCTLARPLPVQNHAHRLRAAASKGFGAPEEPQTTAQEVRALWIGAQHMASVLQVTQSLHCGWCMHAGQLPRQGQPAVSVKEGTGAAAGGRASSCCTGSRSSASQATSSNHRTLLHPSPATQLSSAPLHTSGCRGPHVQAHDCMCRHPSGHGHLAPGHVLLPEGKLVM